MKSRLITEIRALMCEKLKFIITVIITMLAGMLTWLTCDGILFIWKASKHPPLTVPFAIFFLIWMLVYGCFGVLIVITNLKSCKFGTECLRCTYAYLISLFWCPLGLLAGAWFMASLALIMSEIFLVGALIHLRNNSVFGTLIAIPISVITIYSLIFSLSMAFIC